MQPDSKSSLYHSKFGGLSGHADTQTANKKEIDSRPKERTILAGGPRQPQWTKDPQEWRICMGRRRLVEGPRLEAQGRRHRRTCHRTPTTPATRPHTSPLATKGVVVRRPCRPHSSFPIVATATGPRRAGHRRPPAVATSCRRLPSPPSRTSRQASTALRPLPWAMV